LISWFQREDSLVLISFSLETSLILFVVSLGVVAVVLAELPSVIGRFRHWEQPQE
jgi:hypothetical protein